MCAGVCVCHPVYTLYIRNAVYLHVLFLWTWLPASHGYQGPIRPDLGPQEYCEAETFSPVCQIDEVVVMTEANYGRMSKGRCVQVDYGYMGCVSNVMSIMDYRCSGRHNCSVRLPDTELDDINKCPREFKTYLNASYTCVQVEETACQLCKSPREDARKARLSLTRGYIASWTTKRTDNCGSAKCPWVIEAQPGQKINITLYDFSTKSQPKLPTWQPNSCTRFGVIKETAAPSDTPICKGQQRESHLYTSVSNSLEIHVVSPEVLSKNGQFLLYFEAVGCPDYDPPDHAYMHRDDKHLVVGCESTGQEWDLYCVGTEWEGKTDTCPPGAPLPRPPISLPLGVLIAIVVGIALVIGVLILTVGIVCLKRQQQDLTQRSETTLYVRAPREPDYREDPRSETRLVPKYDTTQMTLTHKPPTRVLLPPQQTQGTSAHGGPRENLYCRRMDQRPLPSIPNLAEQPLPPPPSSSDDDVDRYRVQVHRTGSGREQLCHYQPRVVTRRAHSTGSSSRDDPQYFVLDPDDVVIEGAEMDEAKPSSSRSQAARSKTPTLVPTTSPAMASVSAPGSSGAGPSGAGSHAPPLGAASKAPPSGAVSKAPPVGAAAHALPKLASAHALPSSGASVHAPSTSGAPVQGPSCAASSSQGSGSGSSSKPQHHSMKANQKSPEEENSENNTKEIHINNSCHEIPLRPSREGSQTNKQNEPVNTGNSSWP